MRARIVALAAAGWLTVGAFGVWAYGHNYYRYRGFGPPHDPAGVAPGRLVSVRFFSPALGSRRSYDVYLPPGYSRAAAGGTRFGVLYLLHGSPGGPRLFVDGGNLGVAMDVLVARERIRPFLIVLPDGRGGGYKSDTEWVDSARGRYESFVFDVIRAVDRRWPTIADRDHRALAGNSEGAYAAVNLALRHLDVFGTVESWSGYFTQTRTGPFEHAGPALLAANSPALSVAARAPALARLPLHAFLYGGNRDRDTRQLAAFASRLRAAGAHVTARVYVGRHDWRLWREKTPLMLRYAAARIAAP